MPMPAPAPVSTNTLCPCATSSRTLVGVSPTRYSRTLISFGTPSSMKGSPDQGQSSPEEDANCASQLAGGLSDLKAPSKHVVRAVAERLAVARLAAAQVLHAVVLGDEAHRRERRALVRAVAERLVGGP